MITAILSAAGKESIRCENIVGYRVGASLQPQSGMDHRFYLYLLEVMDATKRRFSDSALPATGKCELTSLALATGERDYMFGDIDLFGITTAFTRSYRYRLWSFRYSNNAINLTVTVPNGHNEELEQIDTIDKADVAGAGSVPLLAFEGGQSTAEANVFRLSKTLSRKVCWVKSLVDSQKGRPISSINPFSIALPRGTLDINAGNLERCYIHESFGCFQRDLFALPQASDCAEGSKENDWLRVKVPTLSGEHLLQTRRQEFSLTSTPFPETAGCVETLTVAFKRGTYPDFPLN